MPSLPVLANDGVINRPLDKGDQELKSRLRYQVCPRPKLPLDELTQSPYEKLDGLGAKSKARIIGSADRKVSTNMYETNVRQDTDVRSLRQRARDLVLV